MAMLDIPAQYRGIIPLDAGETVSCNGYQATRSQEVMINGQPFRLFKMKGETGRGLFLVLYDPAHQEWYKVAGTPGLVKSIDYEKLGVSKSLELNELQALANQVQILEVLVTDTALPALRSPHLGPTVEFLNKENRGDRNFQLWLYSIYQFAFEHALELFRRFDIWVEDPNPGNIILHPETACDQGCVVLIDFASKTRRKNLNTSNEQLLQNKFAQQADRLIKR